MTRAVAGGGIVAIALSLLPLPVAAQTAAPSTPPTTGGCVLDRDVCAALGQSATPAPKAQPVVATRPGSPGHRRPSAPTTTRIVQWERRPPRPSAAIICTGDVYEDRLVVIESGEILQSKWTCIPEMPKQPDVGRQPDAGPTVTPLPEEVWERVPLPLPAWGLSPAINGMTGLPTRLWDPNGGAPVTASVDLGGFTASTTAKPVRYEWKMWDAADVANRNPTQAVVSTVPGSEAKPAGSYTYETRGDFTVTQTITWVGTSTFVGPGVNQVVDLGTTTTSSTRSYHVIEVRGVRLG